MGSDLTAIINRGYRSSFFFSFSFLPKDQKDAINTVYSFCRITDDIVDEDFEYHQKLSYLKHWRIELEKAINYNSEYYILNKLMEIARKFHIPIQHFYELIQGVELDVYKNRYKSFEELRKYCTLVASSVGLMVIKIFAPMNEHLASYAENLGIALQLTNILRDVKTDAKLNRIYIPLEDLEKFGYSEKELLDGVYNENFKRLMEFEVARAEEFYEKARHCLKPEDKIILLAPKIMERIYYHTLQKIKAKKYNVFQNTIRIPNFIKFLIAIKYFIKIRVLKKHEP